MVDVFKHELLDHPTSFICSKWILDRIPFVFNEDRVVYLKWQEELATRLAIDPKSMVMIGSASCGFSLNPYKNYKEYH